MVIAERLAYLRSMVRSGYAVSISFLPNPRSHRLKVKLLLAAERSTLSRVLMEPTLAALDHVALLAGQYSAVDRGHRHTCGTVETAILFFYGWT